jgi:hypothetical protein
MEAARWPEMRSNVPNSCRETLDHACCMKIPMRGLYAFKHIHFRNIRYTVIFRISL